MAYNPHNKLIRVKMVQDVYLKYSQEGVTDIFIYENYIHEQFNISERTFYNWLAINVRAERNRTTGGSGPQACGTGFLFT